MKTLTKIMHCALAVIKKNFFKSQKNDKYHECERALKMALNEEETKEKQHNEEYLKNYNVTTRWQTI